MPAQCLRPDVRGEPRRLYSYGEAVDGDGRAIKNGDAPLSWGGNVRAMHARRQIRALRPQGLRGARPEFRRLCRHRYRRTTVDHRALQGIAKSAKISPSHAARFRPGRRPGCSISTTRSIRITCSGSRSTSASAPTSPNFLKVSKDEAFRVQKDYYKRYGTTMRGLMTEHGTESRRLSRIRAPDRPFAARAQSGARRRDREAAGPQTHPHQRHPQARRRGDAAARNRSAFRGRVRHRRRRPRAEAAAAGPTSASSRATTSIRSRPPCSRISRAIWKCRTRSA